MTLTLNGIKFSETIERFPPKKNKIKIKNKKLWLIQTLALSIALSVQIAVAESGKHNVEENCSLPYLIQEDVIITIQYFISTLEVTSYQINACVLFAS